MESDWRLTCFIPRQQCFLILNYQLLILKYALNINDINSGDNNTNNGETLITDLINSLDVNFEIELNNNPYNEYIEPEC